MINTPFRAAAASADTIDTGVEMTRAHGQEMTSRTSDRYTQTDQLAPKISGGASATITAIASTPNNAILVLPEATTVVHQKLISTLAARNRLPAVYSFKFMVGEGALMSYGIVSADHYRQAAFYVDRILRGAKPAELPVQAPTKYETALNLKTAKALGLTPPAGLIVAADEVIE